MEELQRAILRAKWARETPVIRPNFVPLGPKTELIPADRKVLVYHAPPPKPRAEPVRPTMATIVDVVCSAYSVNKGALMSRRKVANVVLPRQIVFALCYTMTKQSTLGIGRFFKRDHTTIIHAHRKVAAMRQADPEFDAQISALEKELGGRVIVKKHYGTWESEELNHRLIFLVTQTTMPFPKIAETLNQEFGAGLTTSAVYGRATWLKLKWVKRHPQRVLGEAA